MSEKNVETYKKENETLLATVELLRLQNEVLSEQLAILKKQVFGRKSEKTPKISEEQIITNISLFNELEECQKELKNPKLKNNDKKSSERLSTQIKENVNEVINHELEELNCPNCNNLLHSFKSVSKYELVFVPATYKVVEHKLHSYACRNCELTGTKATIVKANTGPVMPLDKCCASSLTLANIMYQKYANHLPLYRIEQDFKANTNVSISRQTLSNWLQACSDRYLSKLYSSLKQEIKKSKIINADETSFKVLQRDNKTTITDSKSFMWVYCGSVDNKQIRLYEYQPGRSAVYPESFLKGFKGYLQTDGYIAYKSIEDVTNIGCLAHARRKFNDASSLVKTDKTNYADIGLDYCNQLFYVEQIFQDGKLKYPKTRKSELTKIFKEFKKWLDDIQPHVNPKGALGKAVSYSLNQWKFITNVILDDDIELSNNKAERAIRPFVIGRKNWLFSNSVKGAKTSAIIYSIIESAKANRLNILNYLEYAMATMAMPTFKEEDIKLILPTSKSLPTSCYAK